MNIRKKVLVISSKCPFVGRDGATIRTMQMIRMLAQLYELDLVYTCFPDKMMKDKREISSLCNHIQEFQEPKWKCFVRTLWGFCVLRPLQCSYFYSPRMARYVKERVNQYDYIFCNNIRTVPYIERLTCKKIIDYVDAISMNYFSAVSKANLIWRYIYLLEAKRLVLYEEKVLKSFDKHFIISDIDCRFILKNANEKYPHKKIEIVTNSVEFDDELVIPNNSRNIVFVGSMFYEPNVVAVTTFAKHVLPLILKNEPQTMFYVVGTRPTSAVQKLASEHVVVTGFVSDPKVYLRQATVVVAPMYSGAGVQNKIIEAMSIGCCVVTTKIGAEGLEEVRDGEQIFIRTDFQEMANAIVLLMRDYKQRELVGKRAKQYVASHLTFERIFNKFKNALADMDKDTE